MNNKEIVQRSVTTQEQRAFIKISLLLNNNASEIYRQLCSAIGNNEMNLRTVQDRCKYFKAGNTETKYQRGGDYQSVDNRSDRLDRIKQAMDYSRA